MRTRRTLRILPSKWTIVYVNVGVGNTPFTYRYLWSYSYDKVLRKAEAGRPTGLRVKRISRQGPRIKVRVPLTRVSIGLFLMVVGLTSPLYVYQPETRYRVWRIETEYYPEELAEDDPGWAVR